MSMHAAAKKVVRTLHEAGHTALFAGGCVRDMVMGRRPNDYDVATSAEPPQVIALFKKTQKVGAKFGVVLVHIGGHAIEVATFRKDVGYTDGRHPTAVEFTDAREDALRRDFTINGMFYDPIGREVVDHVGGQADIRARLIRAIGEPDRRFHEDHLRLLRAIRFAARLKFTIESKTWSAIRKHAAEIRRISPERVREELDMILCDRNRAWAFDQLVAAGLLAHLWPSAATVLPRAQEIQDLLTALPKDADFELGMAVIFGGMAPYDVDDACDALRCSNQSKQTIGWLVARTDALDDPQKVTLADLKLLMSHPAFPDLMSLLAARLKAAGLPPTAHRHISARAKAIRLADVAPPPLLTGHDLPALGAKRGPAYKKILDRVYYAQLNEEIHDRAAAKALARQIIEELNQ